MSELWHTLLYQPLVNALILFYQLLFANLGLAIIVLTVVVRGLLIPLTLPSMKASQKMKELAPELEKLKKRHKNDKQALARAQMELYKKHGANPAAGCLPQIIQLVVLVALFQAFRQVLFENGDMVQRLNQILYEPLKLAGGTSINTRFLYLDLTKPDIFSLPEGVSFIPGIPGFFLIAAALTQFLSSKMMMPKVKQSAKVAEKTPGEMDDMAVTMQKQMVYLFPLMTLVIGFSFPSGLVLYWFTFSLLMALQQYFLRLKSEPESKK